MIYITISYYSIRIWQDHVAFIASYLPIFYIANVWCMACAYHIPSCTIVKKTNVWRNSLKCSFWCTKNLIRNLRFLTSGLMVKWSDYKLWININPELQRIFFHNFKTKARSMPDAEFFCIRNIQPTPVLICKICRSISSITKILTKYNKFKV